MKMMGLVRAMATEERQETLLRRSPEGWAEVAEGRDWFEVDPDVVYPEALSYTRQLVDGTASPPSYLSQLVLEAQQVPQRGWELADSSDDPEQMGQEDRSNRAAALESARRVAWAFLREQNGGPIGIQVLRRDKWRL